jgi:gas vesicle protein
MGLFKKSARDELAASFEPNKKKKSCYGGILTGIVVGGAVGSVASLLFAPKKGKDTRADVAEKGKELFSEGKTKAEEFLDKYRK